MERAKKLIKGSWVELLEHKLTFQACMAADKEMPERVKQSTVALVLLDPVRFKFKVLLTPFDRIPAIEKKTGLLTPGRVILEVKDTDRLTDKGS